MPGAGVKPPAKHSRWIFGWKLHLSFLARSPREGQDHSYRLFYCPPTPTPENKYLVSRFSVVFQISVSLFVFSGGGECTWEYCCSLNLGSFLIRSDLVWFGLLHQRRGLLASIYQQMSMFQQIYKSFKCVKHLIWHLSVLN